MGSGGSAPRAGSRRADASAQPAGAPVRSPASAVRTDAAKPACAASSGESSASAPSASTAGRSAAIQAAIRIVGATRIGAYAAWTASVRSPFAAALLYILPVAVIVLATTMIFYGERIRPALSRAMAPLATPFIGLGARLRRS